MAHETRNPSPPPLTQEEQEALSGDFIGDTIFSKRWVLDLLMKLYKHDPDLIYNTKNPELKQEQDHAIPVQEPILNENFENSMCELWDMSANNEVALFLYENDCLDVFLDAMEKTQSPRLMEICLGLLGNLVCCKEICANYSGDILFRESVLGYLSVTDALSLVELTRMVCTCVNRDSCKGFWVESIKKLSSCDKLIYLLKNSLNIDLISRVVEIIDVVFDADTDVMDACLSDDFLNALLETYSSLTTNDRSVGEAVMSLIHILQTVTTVNKGIKLLSSNHEKVSRLLIAECLSSHPQSRFGDEYCDDDTYLSEQCRLPYYASVFSTLSLLLEEHSKFVLTLINNNIRVLKDFLTFLRTKCDSLPQQSGKDSSDLPFAIYMSVCFEALYGICVKLSPKNLTTQTPREDNLSCIEDCIKEYTPAIKDMIGIIIDTEQSLVPSDDQSLIKTAKLLGDML